MKLVRGPNDLISQVFFSPDRNVVMHYP